MKIVTLVEDNKKIDGIEAEHGVSFFIETQKHKLLFDLGQGDLFSLNAKKLNIDLTDVDTVIISHGHYDHGGGLKTFLNINSHAKIYIQASAIGEFYSEREKDQYTYIGLDKTLDRSRFVFLEGDSDIDEELSLISQIEGMDYFPNSNHTLYKKENNKLILDDFKHEQSLLVQSNQSTILFAGCAHQGIVNIINQVEKKLDGKRINIVLGGFHLKSRYKEYEESTANVKLIGEILKDKKIDKYYTGHCTGQQSFLTLKDILNNRLFAFYPGLIIEK
ncbi:MBL fold metallo-hydrolase [Mycoplasmatota bacterium]|nr:MBL fold metallo-hydrolase [Mycoplasmatota bacterium]